MEPEVLIVDYGMGNLGSIVNMVKKVGGRARLSRSEAEIDSAERVVLPGVGHFAEGMKNLQKQNLIPALKRAATNRKIPFLGICLGAQLMTERSEEGQAEGLGFFRAKTVRFRLPSPLKVPHMGWNEVQPTKPSLLFKNLAPHSRFYFVHSYFLSPEDRNDVALQTQYGDAFASALEKENLFACQFHPEKSHRFGMLVMKNFLELQSHA